MSVVEKIKTFFSVEDDDMMYEEYEEQVEKTAPKLKAVSESESRQVKKNVIKFRNGAQAVTAQVFLIEPRTYADSQSIADHLMSKRSVVINLQRIEADQARRILDFIAGNVYAINGDIQRIGSNIFICTPDTFEVNGTISTQGYENENIRW